MLLLATQAEPQMLEFAHSHLGRLVQPRECSSIEKTVARGVPWAADNDCYTGFNEAKQRRYERMLDRIAGLPNCLFVACPDAVGEAGLTDLLFSEWAPHVLRRGLPLAYVVQEAGCEYEPREVHWSAIQALFIGCALNQEKLGPRVRALAREAKQRAKWVHMGRVNTPRRVAYAREIDCDSIDGTGWVCWRDRHLPAGLGMVQSPPQLNLWDEG